MLNNSGAMVVLRNMLPACMGPESDSLVSDALSIITENGEEQGTRGTLSLKGVFQQSYVSFHVPWARGAVHS